MSLRDNFIFLLFDMKLSLNINWRLIATIILVVLLTAGISGSSFYFGALYGAGAPKVISLDLRNVNSSSTAPDFNTFWQAWNLVKTEALKGSTLSDQQLLYGAIQGIVGSLGDPHSVYFPPVDAAKFNEDISGSFSGVGMEIGKKDGQLMVIAPLEGSPAEKAGIKAKDAILKIDKTLTDNLQIEDAVKLIRGPEGTQVDLLLYRSGWVEPKHFVLTRGQIIVPTVKFEMMDSAGTSSEPQSNSSPQASNDIAYLHLLSFNEKSPQLFYDALNKAKAQNAKGIIVDMRNNPGGYLEASVDIANFFLPKDTLVVSEEFRGGMKDDYKTDYSGDFQDIPVVVLVNGGSASAAEIFAGALHDQKRAQLIGETTFGKGTVQTLKSLTDNSQIKLTIAHWILPSGKLIDNEGIDPDISVPLTDENTKDGKDPQLDKAMEEIKKLL